MGLSLPGAEMVCIAPLILALPGVHPKSSQIFPTCASYLFILIRLAWRWPALSLPGFLSAMTMGRPGDLALKLSSFASDTAGLCRILLERAASAGWPFTQTALMPPSKMAVY
jgi:hypothetical protein